MLFMYKKIIVLSLMFFIGKAFAHESMSSSSSIKTAQAALSSASLTSNKEGDKTGVTTGIFPSIISISSNTSAQVSEEKAAAENLKPTNSKRPIIPHKATYEVTLAETQDKDVADAKGSLTIQVIETGDGWATEQKSNLILYNAEGEAEHINTTIATWESTEGNTYSFSVRSLFNGEQEEFIQGHAQKNITNDQVSINYQLPDETQLILKGKCIFPISHLILSLQAAREGKRVISYTIFDGTTELRDSVDVNTFIGTARDPQLVIKNSQSFKPSQVWPMRMAIYNRGSNGLEPDYEMEQNVLDVGVLRDMTLDFGTFKVKATLGQIDLFS